MIEPALFPIPGASVPEVQGVGNGHWYVMQTKPRQEARVVAHLGLRASDIKTFLPKIEVTRKRAGRRVVSIEPMFPSYLFVRTHLDDKTWNAVRWTPGTIRILGDGEHPIPVPEELVQSIWGRLGALGFVRVGLNLSPGQRVRVSTGPFAGLEGIFERATSRVGRVRVLLDILATVTPLELEALDIERV